MAVTVSVVVPAFQASTYLQRAIESALAQTVEDLEVVVIDDASTDGTWAVATRAAAQDPRVKLVRRAVNGGPGAARNDGIAAARGQWVALLDADDRMSPHRIERLLQIGVGRHADVVSDNLLLQPESGGPARPMLSPEAFGHERTLSFAEFVAGNTPRPGAAARSSLGFMQPLIRTGFLQRHAVAYNPRLRNGEDYLLALELLAAGARWRVTPEAMYHYTVRRGSLTEQQGDSDIRPIAQHERMLLRQAHIRRNRDLARALRRHTKALERIICYRDFAASLKAGRVLDSARMWLRDPQSFGLIGRGVMDAAPRMLARALERMTSDHRDHLHKHLARAIEQGEERRIEHEAPRIVMDYLA